MDLRTFATVSASLVLTAGLAMTPSTPAFAASASEPIGKVISVKNSGYATRLQQSVKHTIKAGDTLYSGDQIDVKAGNYVQIAMDQDKNNIIHVPGGSMVQITKDKAITLDLSRGKVFALLDRLEPGTQFKVMTPTAVSTVRGTYFGVKQVGGTTETHVYRGEVGVNGRQADGKNLGAAVRVLEGQMTVTDHVGTRPKAPKRMSRTEFEEINHVIGTMNGVKQPLTYTDGQGEDKGSAGQRGGSDRETALSDKPEADPDANAGGRVVF